MEVIFRMINTSGFYTDLISFNTANNDEFGFDVSKLFDGIIVAECVNVKIFIRTAPCFKFNFRVTEITSGNETKRIYTLFGKFSEFVPKIIKVER